MFASGAPAATSGPGVTALVWAALISGSVISAVVGAFVTTLLARRKSREEQVARVRVMLAEAFQAVAEYKEFPYAIRQQHDAASQGAGKSVGGNEQDPGQVDLL